MITSQHRRYSKAVRAGIPSPFRCSVCEKVFKSDRALKIHYGIKHKTPAPVPVPVLGDLPMQEELQLILRVHETLTPLALENKKRILGYIVDRVCPELWDDHK